jgi:hypothetical protein
VSYINKDICINKICLNEDSITNFSVLSAKIIVERFKLHSYKGMKYSIKKRLIHFRISQSRLSSKGFFDEITVQDLPIRALGIRNKTWGEVCKNEYFCKTNNMPSIDLLKLFPDFLIENFKIVSAANLENLHLYF